MSAEARAVTHERGQPRSEAVTQPWSEAVTHEGGRPRSEARTVTTGRGRRAVALAVGSLLWSVACDPPRAAVIEEGRCVFEGCGGEPGGPGDPGAATLCRRSFTDARDFSMGVLAGVATEDRLGALRLEALVGTWTSPPFVLCVSGAQLLTARFEAARPAGSVAVLKVRTAETPNALEKSSWRPVDAAHGLPAPAAGARYGQVALVLGRGTAATGPVVHRIDLCVGRGAGLARIGVRHAVTGRPVRGAEVDGGPCGRVSTDREGVALVPFLPGAGPLSVGAVLFEPASLPQPVEPGRVTEAPVALRPTGLWPEPRGNGRNHGATPITATMATPPGLRWSVPLSPGNFPRQVVLADVGGGPAVEILTVRDERLEARRGDGTLLWRSGGGAGDEIGAIVGVVDLDGDGEIEVIGGNFMAPGTAGKFRLGRLTILAGRTGAVRFAVSLIDLHGGFGTVSHIRPGFAQILNADADPEREIVVSAEYSHEVRVFDFSAGIERGETRWAHEWAGYRNYRKLAAGDLDGDGLAEAVVGATGQLVVLDGRDGTPHYTPPLDRSTVFGNIFLRDIQDDPRPEILFVGYHPQRLLAYAMAPDGTLATLYDHPLDRLPLAAREMVGDVDADGQPELVFQVGDFVQVRDAGTGTLETSVRGALRGLFDLDADGRPEVLVDPEGVGLDIHGADGHGALAFRVRAAGVGFAQSRNPWIDKYTRAHWNDALPDPGVMRDTPLHEESVSPDGRLVTRERNAAAVVAVDLRANPPVRQWRFPMAPGVTFGVVGQADLDGDVSLEAVVALGDGTLLVIDSAGAERARFGVNDRLVTPLVTDLDGDGTREVLFGGRDTGRSATGVGPLVVRAAATGEPLPAPFGHAGNLWFEHGAAPRALTVGGAGSLLVQTGPRTLAALTAEGAVRWQTLDFEAELAYFAAGDLTGTGRGAVYVSDAAGGARALDAETGATLWSQAGRPAYGPAVVDLDADGALDLAATDQAEYYHAWRGSDGATLFDREYVALCAMGLTVAADLDGDGEDELATSGNYASVAIERTGRAHWTSFTTEGNKEHFAAVLDVNGDAAADLVQPNNHAVYALDGRTGAFLWVHAPPTSVAFTDAVAADLDGDAAPDILVGAGDGLLRLLDAATGAEKWHLDLGDRMGDPVIADLDADGDAEILVAVAGELRAYDEGQPAALELRGADVRLSDAFPRAGQPVTVRAVVRNVGGARSAPVEVRLLDGAAVVATRRVEVGAGEAAPVDLAWTPAAGERDLVVEVAGQRATRRVRVSP